MPDGHVHGRFLPLVSRIRRSHPTTALGVSSATAVLLLLCASSCQSLYGDFELSADKAAPGTLPVVCRAGEHRCEGPLLRTCNASRTGWTTEDCLYAGSCNLNSDSCRPCRAGEHQCNGPELEHCVDDAWQSLDSCATAELCQVSLDALAGECRPPLCEEGSVHCEGARLLRCPTERDRFTQIEVCATEAQCSVVAEQTGRCDRPLCLPNQYSCLGSALVRCNRDLTGWDRVEDCNSAAACSPAGQDCAGCQAGERFCDGPALLRCSTSGTWEVAETCAGAELCDAPAGLCRARNCEPGSVRCEDVGGVADLQRCGPSFAWELVEKCASLELCNAADQRCDPPLCAANDTRCEGNWLKVCNAERTGWDDQQECPLGQLCDPLNSCVPACELNSFRCNGTYLELCTGDSWERRQRCATAELCQASRGAGGCLEPVCGAALGSARCDGGSLENCAPGRNDWEDRGACPTGATLCDPGAPLDPEKPDGDAWGPGQCDICIPGTFSCTGKSLHRCSGDGRSNFVIATCDGECTDTGCSP